MKSEFTDATIEKDPGAFPASRRKKPPRKGAEPNAPKFFSVLPWALKTLLKQTFIPASDMSRQNPEATVMHQDSKWWRLSQYDSAVVSNADGTGASWYKRDRDATRRMLKETAGLHLKLHSNWEVLSEQYRSASPGFTSMAEWQATFDTATEHPSSDKT
jgi:galactofuranosylgalactofuranosylrhamnosyl-N-acetylglucosaminyl-diphospho-decaprenol beta-1,5/1,6-galactofuranosyltransferase